ncbi:MAG: hypothetical protein U1E89_22255 [Burkholderiaceae bacterium]
MSIGSPDLLDALADLRAMRKADRNRDLSSHIETLLSRQWSAEDAFTLRCELVGEFHHRGRNAEAEALLLAEVEREPNEPFHSYTLAGHFHYYNIDLQRSLHHIAQAIAKARTDGKFMYASLGVQARLAVATQNWSLLERTLQELAAYEHTPGNADTFPETDFLPRIPPGAVAPEAVESYVRRVEHLRTIGYSTMHGARRPQS